MRILLIDDDIRLAAIVRRGLELEGHAIDVAGTADRGIRLASTEEHDVLLVDVMLPGRDGFEVCRTLRSLDVWAPILMLTARGDVDDRVRGLDAGADDYLAKPFAFAELSARVRALGRRGASARPTVLRAGGLELDPARLSVRRGEDEIALSAKEFGILEALMRNPGHVLSRTQLLEHAWDFSYESRSNVVDVYIKYIRDKIDRPFGTDSIETIRGVGYRLRP